MAVTTDATNCHPSAFRSLIHDIDQDLTAGEITDIKFLLRDKIRQGRLETCSRLIDIVEELETLGEVSAGNTDLIIELVYRIGRNDLVKKLGQSVAGFKKYLNERGSRLPLFRVMLHEIAEDMVKRERQSLLFAVKDDLPASKLEGVATTQGIFLALENAELLAEDNVSVLIKLLTAINRMDLIEVIARYKPGEVVGPGHEAPRYPLPPEVAPTFIGAHNSNDYYKMDAKPRGVCLIINNYQFQHLGCSLPDKQRGRRQFRSRRGSEVDAESLRRSFTRLHFDVVIEENLSCRGMDDMMARYAASNHANYDCFVSAILSHGTIGHVYGVDGWPITIRDLSNHFKPLNCPTLKGKPKIFFIQACQGSDKDIAVRVESDSPMGENAENDSPVSNVQPDANEPREPITLPNEADFLLGYSTMPGFVSFRDIDSGSWYISSLSRILDEYANREHLLDILTRVNQRVSREIFENTNLGQDIINKQIPAPLFTLRKKVFFY